MEYPLKIENVGEDIYGLMSRGHHEFKAFEELVKHEKPSWFKSLGYPVHTYFKNAFGYYIECAPKTRGCFPVTYITEGQREVLITKE